MQKVDTFSAKIVLQYQEHIICRRGCNDCCQQNLTVLPIEFAFLRENAQELLQQAKQHAETFVQGSETQPCSLLHEGSCLLYSFRPIICRTHGLPLVIREHGEEIRDCCPKNFSKRALEGLPEQDLLQLETLNTILIALNNVFCAHEHIDPGKRTPISDLLSTQSPI